MHLTVQYVTSLEQGGVSMPTTTLSTASSHPSPTVHGGWRCGRWTSVWRCVPTIHAVRLPTSTWTQEPATYIETQTSQTREDLTRKSTSSLSDNDVEQVITVTPGAG